MSVRKDRCPHCDPYFRGWCVTDDTGTLRYYSWTWRRAIDYAYAATQPGTGVQVQHTEREKTQ